MEMIEARAAGVIYTVDPRTENTDTLFVHSVKGAGENLVSGRLEPHLFCFDKNRMVFTAGADGDSPINR